MPHLSIAASGEHAYDVTLTHDSGATTRHQVTVPESLLASSASRPRRSHSWCGPR
jgi:hypothetical protein